MSADEDTELRDLVAQTLEANGTLGKLRAQLRASVFLALEDQENGQSKTPFLSKELKSFLSTKDGKLTAYLVQEFLEFFNLEFTLAVFKPETGLNEGMKRSEVLKSLGGEGTNISSNLPIITSLLQNVNKSKSTNFGSGDAVYISKNLTDKQIEEAKKKFDFYDKDSSGAIDKEELRDLFMDMFPNFHRNMLDRYVNDEFAAADKDFNSSIYTLTPKAIDFDEFLDMYKRLFLLCRTVVSDDVGELVSPTHKPASKQTSPQHQVNQVKQQSKKPSSSPPSSAKPDQVNGSSIQGNKTTGKFTTAGYGSDLEEDPFFDDQPVASVSYNTLSSFVTERSRSTFLSELEKNRDLHIEAIVTEEKIKDKSKKVGSGLTSLDDLPSLNSGRGGGVLKSPENEDSPRNDSDMDKNLREVDKRLEELGLDSPNDEFEYEDDFSDVSQKSPRKVDNKPENGSIAEEIDDEEIAEDISAEADDLLKSEKSGFDDLTTDRSISQMDGGFDYMEDPVLP
ncbi:centrosomal protein 43-like isoform X5 [Biomphalaria glabrata]|uniref:Centrosomal protein 43 n=1 Tax=Biomphalaria glabrata TaxID=6526 RepID=A0A9W3ASE2_BIOGL|nr:centrosomal protein 43-like isoform X5 [Biomphalaria glabrata]